MSKFSNYTEINIVDATLRGVAFPLPAGTYLALAVGADFTDANVTANEVPTAAATWSNYARQKCEGAGALGSGWSNTAGVAANANVITFPANNGAASVTVVGIGIYDTLTGGQLLYWSPLVTPKTLMQNDVLSFGTGAITITID